MLKLLWKSITKVVSWGITKIRGGLDVISKKLEEYQIKIEKPTVREVVDTSVEEIEKMGTYKDIAPDIKLPVKYMIETTDMLYRNYVTKFDVVYRVPGIGGMFAETLSVSHDKNLTFEELRKFVVKMLDTYAEEMGAKEVDIISIERIAVLHRKGDSY